MDWDKQLINVKKMSYWSCRGDASSVAQTYKDDDYLWIPPFDKARDYGWSLAFCFSWLNIQ